MVESWDEKRARNSHHHESRYFSSHQQQQQPHELNTRETCEERWWFSRDDKTEFGWISNWNEVDQRFFSSQVVCHSASTMKFEKKLLIQIEQRKNTEATVWKYFLKFLFLFPADLRLGDQGSVCLQICWENLQVKTQLYQIIRWSKWTFLISNFIQNSLNAYFVYSIKLKNHQKVLRDRWTVYATKIK